MNDKFASNYDKIINKRSVEADCDEFAKFLTLGNILDIGCGTGAHGAIFQEKYHFDVHGIEPNPILSTQAENRLWGAVINEKIEDVEPQEAFYDNAIMLFQVFNFLSSPQIALAKTNALLKKGGKLIIEMLDSSRDIMPIGFSLNGKYTRLAFINQDERWTRMTYIMPFLWLKQSFLFWHYSPQDMFGLLSDAGFSLIDMYDRGINKVYIAEKI